MRLALAVVRVTADQAYNERRLLMAMQEAASARADLVLFPEAALTGLSNVDEPAHDLALGQPIPGQVTQRLGAQARVLGLWVGLGLLERAGDQLYDSAVLLDDQGELRLHYRRITPGWHGPHASPGVYCEGRTIPVAEAPWGTMAFAICGDLFDDAVVARLARLDLQWLLFPFARAFDDGSADQRRWDREEMPAYRGQVQRVGCTTLMVNYLADASLEDDNSFGGAFVVDSAGALIAQFPLGREGLLIVDL